MDESAEEMPAACVLISFGVQFLCSICLVVDGRLDYQQVCFGPMPACLGQNGYECHDHITWSTSAAMKLVPLKLCTIQNSPIQFSLLSGLRATW